MSLSVPRHTFNYLDPLLSQERIASLDNFFLELDVATHMIEGTVRQTAARVGYHILRSVAIAVQMVVYGIFTALKYVALAFYYAGRLCVRAVVAIFVTMPAAAQRRFFPTAADIHERWIESSRTAVMQGNFSIEHIVGPDENQHSYREQKALMRSLLIQPLRELPDCNPEWKECCTLMEQIADGDLSGDELQEKEAAVIALVSKEGANLPMPHLPLLTEKFIEAFRAEREFERGLSIEDIKDDPELLLRYPHLLMRTDIEQLIDSAPRDVKYRLLHTKAALLQRSLQQVHQKERQLIEKLPTLLQHLDLDVVKAKYLSDQEQQFLTTRSELLGKRIGKLEKAHKSGGFEYFLLKFEQGHIEGQLEQMIKTQLSIEDLADENRVEEMNAMHEECRNALCTALKSRIAGNTQLQNELKALEELKTSQEQLKALQGMLTKLQELEMLIVKKGGGKGEHLARLREELIEYNTLDHHLALAHKTPEWIALNALTTPQQREEVRQQELAQEVLNLLLETKSECQIPLLLAKADGRSLYRALMKQPDTTPTPKGAYQKIEEASRQFVEAMRENSLSAVKKRLLSITEFVSHIQKGEEFAIIDDNKDLKQAETAELLDFRSIGLNLDTAANIDTWYAQLQEIWIEHMPQNQEKMLLAITSTHARKAKMAECFDQWFESITGKKMGVRLNFDSYTVPDNEAKRQGAIKVFKKRIEQYSTVRGSGQTRVPAQKPKNEGKGFAPELIAQELAAAPFTDIAILDGYLGDVDHVTEDGEDTISNLERLKAGLPHLIPGREIDWKTNWVSALYDYVKTNNCQSLRVHVLSECKGIIQECYTKGIGVPKKVREIFLDHYSAGLRSSIQFEKMHNAERGDFLSYALMMAFGARNRVAVSEEQYERLKQLCSLSFLPQRTLDEMNALVKVAYAPTSTDFSDLVTQISKSLQASSIGLEGVDAETIRQSFKESTLAVDRDSRTLLDHYMSRGTDALSFPLIDYVYTQHGKNLDHHAAREAIGRALIHAHSRYPEETKKYILAKIQENRGNTTVLNQRNLAPPLYIFYCDLLRQLDPESYFSNPEIKKNSKQFNENLLKVSEAHHLLMGFTRTITELCCEIQYKEGRNVAHGDLIHELLRFKIGYQNLKKNHFENKIEITDFLKINADLAETQMVQVDPLLQAYWSQPTHVEATRQRIRYWMSASSNLIEQCISRELGGVQGEPVFKPTQLRGLFTLSPGVILDTLTGVVYNGGQQKINLPPHLQNHPSTRVLGIHTLPYVWDARLNGYAYYIQQDDGRSQPYLIVRENEQKPVIYKKLATTFAGQGQVGTEYLQYVPKEEVTLPTAVMHRMNIQQLWQDDDTLYGYDKEGKLVAIIGYGSITTEKGEYWFMNDNLAKGSTDTKAILELLFKNFDPNEILAWFKVG